MLGNSKPYLEDKYVQAIIDYKDDNTEAKPTEFVSPWTSYHKEVTMSMIMQYACILYNVYGRNENRHSRALPLATIGVNCKNE